MFPFGDRQLSVVTEWGKPYIELDAQRNGLVEQGFPLPPDLPMPGNISTGTYAFISQLVLPKLRNEPLIRISANKGLLKLIAAPVNCTGRLGVICPLTKEITIIGTLVLIASNRAIVARHCIEARHDDQLIVMMDSAPKNPCCYRVVARVNDPSGLDIAVITTIGEPGLKHGFARTKLEEQPVGRHFVIHYAGGMIKQISSGDFIVGTYYRLQHNIFVDAGPLASGCGIFDSSGELIGINVYRTDEYMAQSRKLILLANTTLFQVKPPAYLSQDPIVRPYYAAPQMQSESAVRTFPQPMQTPYRTHAGFAGIFLPIVNRHYEPNAYEGINNATKLVDIINFLTYLKECVRSRKHADSSQIPLSLQSRKEFIEDHQKVHLGSTREERKSFFSEFIASRMENPVFKALAICIHKIASEYYYLNKEKDELEEGSSFVIDLGFIIGEEFKGGRHSVTEIMLEKAYGEPEHQQQRWEFHIYPVDTRFIRTKHVPINWPDFLKVMTNTLQLSIPRRS